MLLSEEQMSLSPLPNKGMFKDVSSFTSLLERGIECARQGSFTEGVTFFTLAREQLPPDQTHLAAIIDAFIQSNASYWQAQQMLNMASRRFAEAEIEQQTRLVAIEKLLPALCEETDQVVQAPPVSQPLKISKSSQPPRRSLQHIPVETKHSNNTFSEPPVSASPYREGDALPDLYITCFGHLEVKRFDQRVALCQNRNGQAVLRYLIAQPKYSASTDMLMAVLWPEVAPEVARRKLQIAVSALRRSLNSEYSCDPGGGYILYKDQFYLLNPTVTVHTDMDEFLSLSQAGRSASGSASIELYERACRLYTDPFLVEDLYADWSSLKREQLSQLYLSMCHAIASYYLEAGCYDDAAKWASEILKEDRCDEKAHRQLIRIYSMQGHRSEALRQYHRCERILAEELRVAPTPETVNVLQALLTSEYIPNEGIERK
jgi:DNA-binding SARP family transcriptional activator